MWFLIRSAVGLVVLGLAAYSLFYVELEGKPLAAHVTDVWRSEVVQEKVGLVRDGMRQQLEDKLVQAQGPTAARRGEDLAEQDRRELERTLHDLQP